MGCLDEQTVVAFVAGALTGARLAETEHHLLECATCAALVAIAVPETSGHAAGGPAPLRPGNLVGRYRLLSLVGRGGIGEVYAAHDPELDRKVAIKILRADADPDDVRAARLQREAQAVAKLHHPNVVAIHDVGTAAGRVFLTMELVEGETLAAWLNRRPRSRQEILGLYVMAGRGLAAAHRAGIVHRDFKPQNVMVAADGTARVMDFGLAAVAASNAPRLTVIGSILGTPLYMAPEQLLGRPVDPRADQFSFCVALYEALYGERPFEGGNFNSLKDSVLAGRPRPPPPGNRVPAALRTALLKGLSVERDHRFADMDELLSAILRASGGRARVAFTTLAVGLGAAALFLAGFVWQRRSPPPPQVNPCAMGLANLASAWSILPDSPQRQQLRDVFLASGEADAADVFARCSQALDAYARTWSASFERTCAAPTADRAEPREIVVRRAACLDQRLIELGALTEGFAHADGRVVRKARAAISGLPPVETCGDPASLAAAPELPSEPAARTRVIRLRNRLIKLRVQAEAGNDWQALQPITALTVEIRDAGDDALLSEALLTHARIRSPFDPDASVPLFEEAYRRANLIRKHPLAGEAAVQLLAITGAVQHRFDIAAHWAVAAEAELEGSGGPRSRLAGWFHHARGNYRAARGQWRLADDDFAASIAIREPLLGSQHPDLAAALVDHARANLVLGHAERALEAAERAIAIAGALHPAGSFPVESARLRRAQALIALARPGEARRELETVLREFERFVGIDHPLLADPLTAIGEAALAEHRPGDARAVLERAWELRATHVADAGAREETAFGLARAVWDAAPADRQHALELAHEAREGYGAIADLAPQLAAVDRWLSTRTARGARSR